MSWSQWPTTAGIPPVINPAPAAINPVAPVLPAGTQYTPEQWAQMQQQNWQQWAQWQQQYQQWHQQYGAEYQKSMTALAAQTGTQPPLPVSPALVPPSMAVPPPLPQDTKPPLPPEEPPSSQKNYNTSLHNETRSNYNQRGNQNWQPMTNAPNQRFKGNQPPNLMSMNVSKPPPFEQKRSMHPQNETDPKRIKNDNWQKVELTNSEAPGNNKLEELSEAEKKFDKQFADWEAQFNKWKEQNASHPDKTQYREYEKKWETWRAQLLERREQMRRKRLNLTSSSPNLGRAAPQPVLEENKLGSTPLTPLTQTSPAQTALDAVGKIPNFTRPPPTINNDPLEFKKPTLGYSESEPEKKEFDTSFLKSSGTGAIPGLDLVKDDEGESKPDVVDEKPSVTSEKNNPDLEALSKGLSSILGDQKLLSMLSMVSQNQNLNLNSSFVNTTSGIPSTVREDVSAHSFDDNSNSNFNRDDETHSSFDASKMDYNRDFDNYREESGDQFYDRFNREEDNFNQFDKGPDNFGRPGFNEGPDRFNRRSDDMSRPPPSFNLNKFDRNQDNFNQGPRGQGSFNAGSSRGPNNFNQGPNRGPDNFNQPPPNFNQGPNRVPNRGSNFNQGPNWGPDNFNKGSEEFRQGLDSSNNDIFNNRGGENFNQDNFRRQDSFNQGPDFSNKAFNQGPRRGLDGSGGPNNFPPNKEVGNFNQASRRGPDGFGGLNREGGSFSQGPRRGPEGFGDPNVEGDNFNQGQRIGSEGFGAAADNFSRGIRRGPEDFGGPNKESDNFNQGPRRGPDGFGGPNREVDNFNRPRRGPEGFGGPKIEADNFNQGPRRGPIGFGGANRESDNFTQGPRRGPEGFSGPSREVDNFNQGPNRGPDNFSQGPNRIPNNFMQGRGPENFRQGPPRGPDSFNQGSDGFRDGPNKNFNQGMDNFNQDRFRSPNDNFGRGPNDSFVRGPSDSFGRGPNDSFGRNGDDDNWNSWDQEEHFQPPPEEDAQSGRWSRNESFHENDSRMTTEGAASKTEEEENILKPATVVDYDHKPLKTAAPSHRKGSLDEVAALNAVSLVQKWVNYTIIIEDVDVTVEPLRTFDYRHKPVNRIPMPQRPSWLLEVVRGIPEFAPLTTRQLRQYEPPRRYPERGYPDRPPYDDYDDRYSRRYYDEPENRSYEKIPEKRHVDSPEVRFRDRSPIDRFERREPEPMFRYRERSPPPPRMVERREERDERDFDKYEAKTEKKLSNPVTVGGSSKVTLIEDLLSPPGRFNRPSRIVIILRGPPGSGKTTLAKLIKDKEVENGGSAPRILSLDDYFMVEQEKEVLEDGKLTKVKDMKYEYEEEMEASYRTSLMKSFKKTITDGYFNFIIVDNVNDKVKYFGEMWSFAKQNGFQVYVCQLDLDVQTCSKRNVHNRTEADIKKCVAGWEPTPSHHPVLDATSLIQSGSISEVEMEEINSPPAFDCDDEEQAYSSKWDTFDCSTDNLAKLDGTNKPLKASRTMEDYLQLDDWVASPEAKPGQKRVRWADLEERKQQEKMRAIGFVVGQTNWDRMMDPTMGGSALTQTKYIERVGRY